MRSTVRASIFALASGSTAAETLRRFFVVPSEEPPAFAEDFRVDFVEVFLTFFRETGFFESPAGLVAMSREFLFWLNRPTCDVPPTWCRAASSSWSSECSS